MKRRTQYVAVGLLTPIFLVAIGLFRYANTPGQGRIQKSQGLNEVKGEQVSYKKIQTSYFSTDILSTLMLHTSKELPGGIYGQYLYSDPAFGQGTQIGITLGHLNGLVLAEIPFVRQRSADTETYKLVGADQQSVTYQSVAHDEYTKVWVHDGDYVAIAVSGQSQNFGDFKDMIDRAVQSWQWR